MELSSIHNDAQGFSDGGWVDFLIQMLIVGIFIFVAARIVLDRGGYVAAVLGAILASLAVALILAFVPGVLGIVLALAAAALILAIVFRTGWLKGAVVGLVAWVLALLVEYILGQI